MVQRLFQAVGMLLKSSLPDKVKLSLDVADERLAVEANFTELQQVLLNLSLNALQAMPQGGQLSLVAERVQSIDGNDIGSVSAGDRLGNALGLCLDCPEGNVDGMELCRPN